MGKEKIGYRIFLFGELTQIIELKLDPGQKIASRAIFNNWVDEGITHAKQALKNTLPTKGIVGKFMSSGKIKLRGQYPVKYFTNYSTIRKRIVLAAPHERQILPISLSSEDGSFLCHKDAFVCTDPGVEVTSMSGNRLFSIFVGSEKFNWLEFRGDGFIFVHVGGRFKNETLNNQSLKLDRRSIIGFTSGITYDRGTVGVPRVKQSDTKANFQGKVSGNGTVYLQSKPYNMPKRTYSLPRDIRDLANIKAIQRYKGNLKKMKKFQWSKLQDLIKTDRLENSLKNKFIPPGRI
jgi:uncharacterized protein (AIM24 family)